MRTRISGEDYARALANDPEGLDRCPNDTLLRKGRTEPLERLDTAKLIRCNRGMGSGPGQPRFFVMTNTSPKLGAALLSPRVVFDGECHDR